MEGRLKKLNGQKSLISIFCILVCMCFFVPAAYAQDPKQIAQETAERAVSEAISSTLSETLREINTGKMERERVSAFYGTPSYTTVDIDIDGMSFDSDVSLGAALVGFIFGVSDKTFITTGLSQADMDMELTMDAYNKADADITMSSLNLGLTQVFSSSDTKTVWGSFDGAYSYLDMDYYFISGNEMSYSSTRGSTDLNVYNIGPSITADFRGSGNVSFLTSFGLKYGDSDAAGSDGIWNTDFGAKIKKITGKVQPSIALKWYHVFASIGDDTDSLSLTPALDFKFSDNFTGGIYYTYSTPLNTEGYDTATHTVGLNFRISF